MPDFRPLATTIRVRLLKCDSTWNAHVDLAVVDGQNLSASSVNRQGISPAKATSAAFARIADALGGISELRRGSLPAAEGTTMWPAPRAWERDTLKSDLDLVVHIRAEETANEVSAAWQIQRLDGSTIAGVYAGNVILPDANIAIREALDDVTRRLSQCALYTEPLYEDEPEFEAVPAMR